MDFFLIAVVVLFALAAADLMVGVSNDAVNFLNSAIGSRVSSRKLILLVAGLGVFLGATFSSGMMEIARKGIFNPEHFALAEIMVIFLAVMITDVIMLDLFNTFGLPTSTTVSIVFELLGAAVVVSLIKILQAGEGLVSLAIYINSDKALTIVSGILLSILVAFTLGTLVQYVSRLLFTFEFERRVRSVGWIWAAFAMTALSYFLIIKGLKGASFIGDDTVGWVETNRLTLLGLSFLFWLAVSYVLVALRIGILKPVVLFGTFALAMAFAGNDLVNFIGVPIAGFESFRLWADSGLSADSYMMEALTAPVRTATPLLLAAGAVMVATLWLSKKARTVTDTEVDLGRQSEGTERFRPGPVSQSIVRGVTRSSEVLKSVVPTPLLRWSETRFRASAPNINGQDGPAFDLVRASVNLTVASIIISFATSMKLPLSTTYVSFMVAMGASLADRAWGRESAVYRVSGVLKVIVGWFATAAAAFTGAGISALLIYYYRGWALAALMCVAVFSIGRTMLLHRRRSRKKDQIRKLVPLGSGLDAAALTDSTRTGMRYVIASVRKVMDRSVQGLLAEDDHHIREAEREYGLLREQVDELGRSLHGVLAATEHGAEEATQQFVLFYDRSKDMLRSLNDVVMASGLHVRNVHRPLSAVQSVGLLKVLQCVDDYLDAVQSSVDDVQPQSDKLIVKRRAVSIEIGHLKREQIQRAKNGEVSSRNTQLVLNLLIDARDVVSVAAGYAEALGAGRRARVESIAPSGTRAIEVPV